MKYLISSIFILLSISITQGKNYLDAIPEHSLILPDYNVEKVENRLKTSGMHAIEGIWQFADNGTKIAIEREDPDKFPNTGYTLYRLVIIDSPNNFIKNGTIMGYATPTAKRNNYEARIYTSVYNGNKLKNTQNVILSINEDNRLVFKEYNEGYKLNIRRLIPYIFRISITKYSTRPQDLDGCIKIFPEPGIPIEPIYL